MRVRKKWLLLLIIIILASCSNNETKDTSEEDGRAMIDLLLAEDYQIVHNEWFDEELKASISADELKKTWEKQIEISGEFMEVTSLQAANQSDIIDVVEAKLTFTKVIFEVRMVFNDKQRLVGFNVSNGISNASLPNSLIEEEVIVGEGTLYELSGTITLPKQNQKELPAVVLVHGSGPSDRDETAFAYKPFRDIAWGLAEQGIAVIRYDKRTYVYGDKSVTDEQELTVYEETVEDAIRATQLVKSDARINKDNVYILGHSLGGMLAPRIDDQGGEYAGIIMLAGSSRPLWDIVYDQNVALLDNDMIDESTKQEQEATIEAEYQKAQQLETMSDEQAKKESVFGMNGYYLKEMAQYDTKSIATQLEKPLLIMQGEDDFQVFYEKDYAMWQELLANHDNATFVSYPNLNHFFVEYFGPEKGSVEEYKVPKQVDTEVIADIGNWISTRQN